MSASASKLAGNWLCSIRLRLRSGDEGQVASYRELESWQEGEKIRSCLDGIM